MTKVDDPANYNYIRNGSDYSVILGGTNTISASSSYSAIIGGGNTIDYSNPYSYIFGSSNTLYNNSNASSIIGTGGIIFQYSPYSFMLGLTNRIYSNSPYSIIGGYNSILSGSTSFIYGSQSYLQGSNSALFGYNISGYSDHTVFVPNFNINYTPSNDNTITKLLVRSNDGTIKTKDVGAYYNITGITAQTLTITDNSNNPVVQILDNSSQSLVQINDISGYPAFEVYSNGGIKFGVYNLQYNSQSLYTTTGLTAGTGTTIVYSLPTTGYTGAFFDYTLQNGLNLRAGSVIGVWSGTSIEYTETSTNDIGSTTAVTFNMSATTSNVYLRVSAQTSGWTIKTMVRSI